MSGQEHSEAEPVNARIFPLPPIVALLFIAAGWLLNRFAPLAGSSALAPLAIKIAGGAAMACAAAIVLAARLEMRRAKTTFYPGGKANALVRGGIFQHSRNPMYLSLALFTLGLGLATANLWMIVLAPALLVYLQERVVKREEAYLTQRFGADYLAYKQKVRRWF